MFLFLVSAFAVISCVVFILFLKFSSDKQHHQQIRFSLCLLISVFVLQHHSFIQNNESPVDVVTFLKSVRSTKPFPISSIYGWKIYCICNDSRVWKRNLIIDNSGNRIQVIGCYVKLNASVQVVAKALKDVSRFVEWRPGVESTTQCVNGSDEQYGCVSHDFINMVTTNQKLSTYSVVVEQKNIERFWKREDNGCFWLLESSDIGLLFYILQPVEEVESCCLTIVSHFTFPVTLQDSAVTVSSHAQSMRDYMFYRKMKITPFLNFHIPLTKSAVIPEDKPTSRSTVMDEQPIVMSTMTDDLTDSSVYSSSDDDNSDNSFHKKFAVLNPVEKGLVLKKSSFILNSHSKHQRLRSHSDTNTGAKKINFVKQRSSTLPKDMMSSRSVTTRHSCDQSDTKSVSDINQEVYLRETGLNNSNLNKEDDVFFANAHNFDSLPKFDSAKNAVIPNALPCKNDTQTTRTFVPSVTDHQNEQLTLNITHDLFSDHDVQNTKEDKENKANEYLSQLQNSRECNNGEINSQSLCDDQKDDRLVQNISSPDDIRYITLANQCAADLLLEFLQVSNIDLKKSISQQSANSGGWAFCGLENDVVILKKTPVDNSSVVSFMGKGLIQASPQTVLETVKKPRTKFTYDDTLKKVDVLNDVTDKIKIVYFYHEVINMFKKSCYDFCVLQTERQDGDKYVLATSSVDTGLPNPVGVQRVQMKPSGWVIEPVQKEKKTYSMATYVTQIDFGPPKTGLDKPPVEELVTKQALSIAFLRQFLKPAQWKSRNQSSPVPRKLSTPVSRTQSSPLPSQQSSSMSRQKSSKMPRQQSSPMLKQQSSPISKQ